jgi:hypothetical protein
MRPLRLHLAAVTAASFVAWAPQAAANPIARSAAPPPEIVNGRWNGVILERRSSCTRPENEGSRGTYAQFDVAMDAAGTFSIGQSGITGLTCNYAGRHEMADRRLGVQGTLSCSDGKQGTFTSSSLQARGTSLEIRMAIQLGGSETCAIDALLSMARFYP